MVSNKQKRYDELIEEVEYVYNNLPIIIDADEGLMAVAILVASEHSNEDLGQLAEFIQKSGE